MQVWANKIIKSLYGKANLEFTGGYVRKESKTVSVSRVDDSEDEVKEDV